MTNEVAINLNVLGPLMEDSVMGNLNSTAVVTIEGGWRRLRDVQVREKTTKPDNFSSSMSHSTIFCFSSRTGNNTLFLAFPRDEGIAKEQTADQ